MIRPHTHSSLRRAVVATVVASICAASCSSGSTPMAVEVPGGVQSDATTVVSTDAVFTSPDSAPTTIERAPATTSAVPTTTATATTTTTSTTTTTTTTTVPVTGWDAFDQYLSGILFAGSDAVSATVLVDGEIVHEVALGTRTQASDDAVEVGDRYRIASISKVITAITVLRLSEDGVVDLDAPIGPRLAAVVGVSLPAAAVEQITPRQLLTHRSGIAQYEDLMFQREVESCPEAASAGLTRALEREPGTTFRYSNLNFCLLGLMIEDVTGRPYSDVVRDELLFPLGLDDMRTAGTFDVRDGDVEHRSDEGRNYMEVLGAAGSWIASPTDIATIINALDMSTPGWKPLRAETVADMRDFPIDPPAPLPPVEDGVDPAATTTTTVPPPPPTRGYGMGLIVFGTDSFGHTGTLESTHVMTARQGDGVTWAIMVSGDHPSSTRDLAGIIDEALRAADTT